MSERIKIISDGITHGTRVLNADGKPIPNVTRVEILPLEGGDADGIVRAVLTVELVELDVTAEVDAFPRSDCRNHK
ncbi:MAG: hypothetical protein ACN6OP_13195 [Pseudomonadales bacterium]